MSGYKKPKIRLHREFVYLNADTIINSLSAFEAGKVDEIIEKVTEAREGGFDGSIGYGGAKLGGSKKKTANIEEELKRTRTTFSAFEEWHRYLDENGGFGELDEWDLDTRNELGVGDTIKVDARVTLSPIQRVLLTYIDFSNQASNPDSAFKQPAAKVAEIKKIARQMSGWIEGPKGEKSILVSIAPLGIGAPRVYARLDERHLIDGVGAIEGEFTVIGQVESLVQTGDTVPAIRILRETPPTPMETEAITKALEGFIEPSAALGVEISPEDITIGFPAVLVHPVAIFR